MNSDKKTDNRKPISICMKKTKKDKKTRQFATKRLIPMKENNHWLFLSLWFKMAISAQAILQKKSFVFSDIVVIWNVKFDKPNPNLRLYIYPDYRQYP